MEITALSFDQLNKIEIKQNYCDKCNQEVWKKVRDNNEFLKNNCEHCGGGRCHHYPLNEEEL